MQLKEFYERVLPAEGRFVLYQNKRNDFFNTLDELVAATERRIKSQGLYFATANYGGKFKVDDQGRKIPVRTQDNVLTLKAFRFDIDAGAEKFAKHPKDAYPTQREALTALVAWIKTSDLMPTLIVSSGEGLHVYWCLDQPADPISWHSVAVKLNAVGRSGGMRVDGGCTADTARVLRPVGTPHKNGKLVAVLKDTGKLWDFREFADKVDSLMKPEDVEASFPARAPRVAKARSINDDVLAVESRRRRLPGWPSTAPPSPRCATRQAAFPSRTGVPCWAWPSIARTARLSPTSGPAVTLAITSARPRRSSIAGRHRPRRALTSTPCSRAARPASTGARSPHPSSSGTSASRTARSPLSRWPQTPLTAQDCSSMSTYWTR
jgi:hypothetical protein